MANIYSPKKLGALIGRSLNALQRWDREEVLPAKRTPTNRLCYIHEDYLRVIGPKRRRNVEPSRMPESPTLGKGGDLKNQREALERFCLAQSKTVAERLEDVGNGLTYKRKNFLHLMEMVERGEIS
jgi:predicted site-specific integrase-resolvase